MADCETTIPYLVVQAKLRTGLHMFYAFHFVATFPLMMPCYNTIQLQRQSLQQQQNNLLHSQIIHRGLIKQQIYFK